MSTKTAADSQVPDLYERDPYIWAHTQACALRERRAEALDWDNLAEEVEDLARRHRDALQSNYEILIEHLLKLAYASDPVVHRNWRLWRLHVSNARMRISDLLLDNPGLKGATGGLFTKAWRYGRNNAVRKLDLDDSVVPRDCPWALGESCDEGFWPAPGQRQD